MQASEKAAPSMLSTSTASDSIPFRKAGVESKTRLSTKPYLLGSRFRFRRLPRQRISLTRAAAALFLKLPNQMFDLRPLAVAQVDKMDAYLLRTVDRLDHAAQPKGAARRSETPSPPAYKYPPKSAFGPDAAAGEAQIHNLPWQFNAHVDQKIAAESFTS